LASTRCSTVHSTIAAIDRGVSFSTFVVYLGHRDEDGGRCNGSVKVVVAVAVVVGGGGGGWVGDGWWVAVVAIV
jgi:uncharacterized membrane protein